MRSLISLLSILNPFAALLFLFPRPFVIIGAVTVKAAIPPLSMTVPNHRQSFPTSQKSFACFCAMFCDTTTASEPDTSLIISVTKKAVSFHASANHRCVQDSKPCQGSRRKAPSRDFSGRLVIPFFEVFGRMTWPRTGWHGMFQPASYVIPRCLACKL